MKPGDQVTVRGWLHRTEKGTVLSVKPTKQGDRIDIQFADGLVYSVPAHMVQVVK